MQGQKAALPNQLFDPGKRSVNTRPTLCSAQPFLDVALLERRESEGAVCARAQLFGADGFLAHQGRRRRCDEDLVLAAVWVVNRLLALFLQIRKWWERFHRLRRKAWTLHLTSATQQYVKAEVVNGVQQLDYSIVILNFRIQQNQQF